MTGYPTLQIKTTARDRTKHTPHRSAQPTATTVGRGVHLPGILPRACSYPTPPSDAGAPRRPCEPTAREIMELCVRDSASNTMASTGADGQGASHHVQSAEEIQQLSLPLRSERTCCLLHPHQAALPQTVPDTSGAEVHGLEL